MFSHPAVQLVGKPLNTFIIQSGRFLSAPGDDLVAVKFFQDESEEKNQLVIGPFTANI